MNRQEIKVVTLSVLSTVLNCDVDDEATRENLVQWDSLMHIQVIFALEDELNLQFPEEVLPDLNSVERIVDVAVGLYEA